MNAFLHYTQVYQHVNSQYGFCLISESSVGRVPTYTVTLDFLRVTSNCSVLLWLNIHRSLDKVRHYRYIHYNWHSVNQLLLMCKKILWVSGELERISQCEPFYPLSVWKKKVVANNSWFTACPKLLYTSPVCVLVVKDFINRFWQKMLTCSCRWYILVDMMLTISWFNNQHTNKFLSLYEC